MRTIVETESFFIFSLEDIGLQYTLFKPAKPNGTKLKKIQNLDVLELNLHPSTA
jgi:hypothetical protein